MKGLILKDLLNLKRHAKTMLIIFVFYAVLAIAGSETTVFGGIIAIMTVMLTITSMAYDEHSNWDKYALTMPLTRRDLVLSKYALGAILSGIALLLNLAFQLLLGSGAALEAVLISLALFGAGILYLSLLLPLLFKLGVERGRLAMIMVLFLPTAVVLLLAKWGILMFGKAVIAHLPYAATVLAILIVSASILISLKIYDCKEL